jgi:hypothetical protein
VNNIFTCSVVLIYILPKFSKRLQHLFDAVLR